MTRARAEAAYPRRLVHRSRYQDVFCLSPIGIRVGFASAKLLRTLPRRQRGRVRGRIVWISTANRFFALRGVRPGTRLKRVTRKLKPSHAFHVGRNFWYFSAAGDATALLKVRRGVIQEIGIVGKSLVTTRHQRLNFLHGPP